MNDIFDIGNGFFMVKFGMKEDSEKTTREELWRI
jgi:hypothetical protein